jgi:hypothetical protein
LLPSSDEEAAMIDGSGARLSLRERLILKHIEIEMRRDHRTSGTARAFPHARTRRRRPGLPTAVALLGAVSVFLMVTGMRTSDPAVICVFALLWPVTLFLGFRLLCRWSRPHTGR